MNSTALTGGVLAVLLVLTPAQAQLVNSTWTGAANNSMNNTANWNNGSVPTGTATFGASTVTSLTLNMAGADNIGDFTFLANAPAYTITVNVFRLNGAGLVNAGNLTLIGNSPHDTILRNTATLDSANFIVNSGGIRFLNSSTAGSATITTNFGAALDGGTRFLHTSNGGTSRHILGAQGLVDITELTSTGTTIGSLEGSGVVGIGGKTLTIGSNNRSTTYAGVIRNQGFAGGSAALAGNLVKTGTGTLTLTGTNTYTGTTTVNGGKLIINGSINNSSSVTVANGGSLGGTASIPNLTVQSGGSLSPGNSIGTTTIAGNLVLNAGSTTLIEIQGAQVDKINVGGTATLNGTLQLVALGGTYNFGSAYNFLTATGGLTGTFATVTTDSAFGVGVTSTVTYNANNAFVTLNAAPLVAVLAQNAQNNTLGLGSTRNVNAVAGAMDAAVAAGADSSAFFNIYNQPTRAALASAVNTLSGEVHTNANAISVHASDQFLRAMLDPFAIGRDTALGASGKPKPKYSVWAMAFGQNSQMAGDGVKTGSAKRDVIGAHVAVGGDFRISPETVIGFAASGGGGYGSLANSLGSAKADVFQAGVYGMTHFGALSLGASAAYTSSQTETDRPIYVLGASSVKGNYRAQGLSGRLEGAYAALSFSGVTLSPFAAVQMHGVRTPTFTETNGASGPAFGVTSRGTTNATSRSELGVKFDAATTLAGIPISAFFRVGWAHYLASDSNFKATLVGLPGASFKIQGARPDRDAVLASLGADAQIRPGLTLSGRIDTELSPNSKSVSGNARLRWSF